MVIAYMQPLLGMIPPPDTVNLVNLSPGIVESGGGVIRYQQIRVVGTGLWNMIYR